MAKGKLCRLFIDGERRWCTANATGAAPGQDSAVGNQATRAAAIRDFGGGEVTRIKWITPRWSVTPAEASRRDDQSPAMAKHTRARALEEEDDQKRRRPHRSARERKRRESVRLVG